MKQIDEYEQQLLSGWEEVAKRGQLTLWILLALKDGTKHMGGIKDFVTRVTNGMVQADDQSMWRALRRYNAAGMIDFKTQPGDGGGERKLYSLTQIGTNVLESYLDRNIRNVYFVPFVEKLIKERL